MSSLDSKTRIERETSARENEIRTHVRDARDAHSRAVLEQAPSNVISIRPFGREGDIRMVTANWMRNYEKGQLVKRINRDVYRDGWHAVLEQIIPRSTILVACHPRSPDVCFGWICGEVVQGGPDPRPTLMLHYAYVKHRFKAKRSAETGGYDGGFGIGRQLLQTLVENEDIPGGVVATCLTSQGGGWLSRMVDEGVVDRWEYDPFLLFSTLPEGWY